MLSVWTAQIATSGRPGPVIVDLPKDVTAAICREAVPTEPQLPGLSSQAHMGGEAARPTTFDILTGIRAVPPWSRCQSSRLHRTLVLPFGRSCWPSPTHVQA